MTSPPRGPAPRRTPRRRTRGYFASAPGAPPPIRASIRHRVQFGDVDAMGIVWHGRYAALFEAASTEARRLCGLTYEAFRADEVAAPIVQLHVDYHRPLLLDELVTVHASLVWSEAARIDTEYAVEAEDGQVAATGYTVQMLTIARTGRPWLVRPPILERAIEAARRTR